MRLKQRTLAFLTGTMIMLMAATGLAQSTGLEADIAARGLLLPLLGIFAAGLLVSLTPCVYPMIPITLSIIGARNAGSTPLVGFARSLVFVLGIASIYTTLGLTVALSGGTIGALLGDKRFLFGISTLFIVMGLGMMGMFNLQLPPSIAAKFQGKGSRGGFVGAFLLGITTGVVASPCGSPVLVSVLTLAGQSGQAVLGGVMLFTYALGVGVLFLVLGAFPAFLSKVPKSGVWMEDVKKMLGVVLIIAAFYYIRLAVPTMLAWGMLLATAIILAILIFLKSGERAQWPRLLWGWRLTAAALAAVAIYTGAVLVPETLAAEQKKMLAAAVDPLAGLDGGNGAPGAVSAVVPATDDASTTESATTTDAAATPATVAATPPKEWVHDEARALQIAKTNGWPVVIDFGAEWCGACMELEKHTFPKPAVVDALSGFMKVKIDCTEATDENEALQAKYNVLSLPAVIFLDAEGNVLPDLTLEKFEEEAAFVERVNKVPAPK